MYSRALVHHPPDVFVCDAALGSVARNARKYVNGLTIASGLRQRLLFVRAHSQRLQMANWLGLSSNSFEKKPLAVKVSSQHLRCKVPPLKSRILSPWQ
ncbi:hypothetical protein FHG87_002572 [Trinorchestia longiramus]|nr:hypothetical protein FHG87_002572 [Trinorchestia longiramus]